MRARSADETPAPKVKLGLGGPTGSMARQTMISGVALAKLEFGTCVANSTFTKLGAPTRWPMNVPVGLAIQTETNPQPSCAAAAAKSSTVPPLHTTAAIPPADGTSPPMMSPSADAGEGTAPKIARQSATLSTHGMRCPGLPWRTDLLTLNSHCPSPALQPTSYQERFRVTRPSGIAEMILMARAAGEARGSRAAGRLAHEPLGVTSSTRAARRSAFRPPAPAEGSIAEVRP